MRVEQRDSNQGTPQNLVLAERIAVFRYYLEQDMINTPWNPTSWQRVYDERLSLNPQLTPYREFFDQALIRVQQANEDLERAWRRRCGPKKQPKTEEDCQLEKTYGFSAQNLYTDIFGLRPRGEPEAIKGAISLRFVVDAADFQKICQNLGKGTTTRALYIRLDNFKFGVLVVNKQTPTAEIEDSINHEFEHAKNFVIGDSRVHVLSSEKSKTSSAITDRMLKRELQDPSEMLEGKNELLASFTFLLNLLEKNPNWPKEEMLDQVKQVCLRIAYNLSTSEEYDFLGKNASEVAKKRYIATIFKGAQAFLDLLGLYIHGNDPSIATRISINVLEQFPITYWPAAVRLIMKKHGVS
ncbi:hypothetical protein HY384_03665 [Candidatus Daviesbacteria bacterium]|nr:hypothetical protein [Candidatus Daviesbacteria bacterium]